MTPCIRGNGCVGPVTTMVRLSNITKDNELSTT